MTTTDGPGRGGSGPGRNDARAGSGRMTVEGATGDLAAARPRLVGARVTRREDPRLLRGEGSFLDDRHVHGMVHLAFRRSETAHGGLAGIDAAAARAMPGVIGVYTAADLAGIARPIRATSRMRDYHATPLRPLALDKVRHVGEPVAAVVAESRYAAEDAAERVALDIAPLPSLVDARSAAADRDTLIHEDAGTNVLAARAFGRGDIDRAMEEAAVRVAGRFRIHRKTPVALEPRGGLAEYDRRSRTLTLHSTTQIPGIVRDAFAEIFAMPGSRVRVIASDVGGGFGAKATLYAEDICVAALALKLGRPVKWSGDRREDLLSTTQAFDETIEATLALDADGTVLALQADALGDVGACSVYPWTACLEPVQVVSFLPGPYRMPVYDARVRAVATSKPAGGPYRGVGRPIAAFVTERLMDMAAAELGMDPVALRRRNLVAEGEFPYKAASGLVWDRSSFVGGLDRACETAGYETLRGQRDATRAAGGWAGVGVACYAELTGLGSRISVAPGMPVNTGTEGASVEIGRDRRGHRLLRGLFPGPGDRDHARSNRRRGARRRHRGRSCRSRRQRDQRPQHRHLCQPQRGARRRRRPFWPLARYARRWCAARPTCWKPPNPTIERSRTAPSGSRHRPDDGPRPRSPRRSMRTWAGCPSRCATRSAISRRAGCTIRSWQPRRPPPTSRRWRSTARPARSRSAAMSWSRIAAG